jgi:hypothetical protein
MTTANISFDENAFIKSVVNKYYNDDNEEDSDTVFDNYFRSFFQNREIRKAIRNKYYLNNYKSLYSILLFKFDEVLIDDADSDAETEEDYKDYEDYEDYEDN